MCEEFGVTKQYNGCWKRIRWSTCDLSSLLKLAPGSRDISEAEKKAEEVSKMRIAFIHNGPAAI